MCLSVPARVVSLEGDTAIVDVAGNRREADVSLLEGVKPGDYVLLHAGFAIGVYDQAEAEETLSLLRELAQAASGRESPARPTGEAAGTERTPN